MKTNASVAGTSIPSNCNSLPKSQYPTNLLNFSLHRICFRSAMASIHKLQCLSSAFKVFKASITSVKIPGSPFTDDVQFIIDLLFGRIKIDLSRMDKILEKMYLDVRCIIGFIGSEKQKQNVLWIIILLVLVIAFGVLTHINSQ